MIPSIWQARKIILIQITDARYCQSPFVDLHCPISSDLKMREVTLDGCTYHAIIKSFSESILCVSQGQQTKGSRSVWSENHKVMAYITYCMWQSTVSERVRTHKVNKRWHQWRTCPRITPGALKPKPSGVTPQKWPLHEATISIVTALLWKSLFKIIRHHFCTVQCLGVPPQEQTAKFQQAIRNQIENVHCCGSLSSLTASERVSSVIIGGKLCVIKRP